MTGTVALTNCATHHQGAWWHRLCTHSNLNGQYLNGQQLPWCHVVLYISVLLHQVGSHFAIRIYEAEEWLIEERQCQCGNQNIMYPIAIDRCVCSNFYMHKHYSAHLRLLSLQKQFTTLRSKAHSLIKLQHRQR